MEEAKGHLERIATGLMTLEAAPDDQSAIDGILREAHTMKGAAGMVGMMRVSRPAHRLEDLLVELRAGTRRSTPELTDSMLLVVDGLGRLIASPTSGEQDASDEAAMERLLPTAAVAVPGAAKVVAVAAAPPTQVVASSGPAPSLRAISPARGEVITPATAPPVPQAVAASAPPPVLRATPPASDEGTTPAMPPFAPAAAAKDEPKTAPPSVDRKRGEVATLEVPVARIDELNRLVGEVSAAQLRVGHVVGTELRRDPDAITEYRELTKVINRLQEVTERTRMVPVGTLGAILRRTVRDTARGLGKTVRWELVGDDVEVDRGVLEQLASPLLHLVRNSVGHGIESAAERLAAGKPVEAVVRLHAAQVGSKVVLTISDDGAGINVAAVRAAAARRGIDIEGLNEDQSLHLIFQTGVSTATTLTETSGRGVGLDVVRTAVEAVHGDIQVVNHPGAGAEFRIVVPITLTVVPCLIVSIAGQSFALPLHRIIRMLEAQNVQVVSGKRLAVIDGQAVPVYDLAELLGMPTTGAGPWVLLGTAASPYAFQVESVLQKRDVVVRGLTGRLRELKAVSGASIEPNGSILLVLDVSMLIERSSTTLVTASSAAEKAAGPPPQLSVVVVDDTLMVRELQRSILERGGYAVRTAGDGTEALAMLNEAPADLVVTDVEMPNLDGLQLITSMRAHPRLANVPVLIVSSHGTDEDRQRGLDAGADGYIVKTSFDEAGLLSAVSRLLGRTGSHTTQTRKGASAPAPARAQRLAPAGNAGPA
ncbi:MAG: hybrid sensor histidine kinase/response regulator [Candidatus Dormibacteraceae bacterium]